MFKDWYGLHMYYGAFDKKLKNKLEYNVLKTISWQNVFNILVVFETMVKMYIATVE